MNKQYYTYIYSDPRTLVPFYVGKGSGNRCYVHLNEKHKHANVWFGRKIKKIKREGLKPLVEKIYVSSEYYSLELEKGLIKKFGRKDLNTGTLLNLNEGGTGYSLSEETKDKIRKKAIGRPNKNKGKRGILKSWNKGLNKNTHNGLMSLSLKMSDIAKKRIGDKNPNYGNHPVLSDETKRKMSSSHKGMIWITNNILEKQICFHETIPDGWLKGRKPKQKRKSLKWSDERKRNRSKAMLGKKRGLYKKNVNYS